jgi:hypothetical protein
MDVRPPRRNELDIGRVEAASFCRARADIDTDAGGPQELDALARYLRKRVRHGHDHAGHLGCKNGVRARGGLAVVAARLERYVEGGPCGRARGGPKGSHLGVVLAIPLMPAGADHAIASDNDGPDQRIGLYIATPAFGQLKCLPHPKEVGISHGVT